MMTESSITQFSPGNKADGGQCGFSENSSLLAAGNPLLIYSWALAAMSMWGGVTHMKQKTWGGTAVAKYMWRTDSSEPCWEPCCTPCPAYR